MMARKNDNHLKEHLSLFEAEYPILKGYIARLLFVDGHSIPSVFREARSIVQADESCGDLHEGSFSSKVYRFKKMILRRSQHLTRAWPSLITLFLQPFPITFSCLPVEPASPQPEHKPHLHHSQSMEQTKTSACGAKGHSEADQVKAASDKDGEVDTLEDISLTSDLSKIDNYVSSNSPSHNTHSYADVEENRTVVYNSHSSVCVREHVLSDRTSNHQEITSQNNNDEMCHTEGGRSGEDKNKQIQKEATESVVVVDFQAMMAGVKDGRNEYSEDLLQGRNYKLLEQGLSACEKIPQCQKDDANIVMRRKKYLNEILVNKWKTKSVASQKSYQPSVLQSDKPLLLQSVQPTSFLQTVQPTSVLQFVQPTSVLQSDKPSVLQFVLPSSVLQSAQPASVLQSVQPTSFLQSVQRTSVLQSVQRTTVLQSGKPSVLQSVQPTSVVQSVQPTSVLQSVQRTSVLPPDQPSVLQSVQPSVLRSAQISVLQSHKCKFCGHVFILNSSQRLLLNTGKKSQKCSMCGRLDTILTRDTTQHTENELCESRPLNDKFYKCDLCDRTYKMYFLLKNHRLKHTRDRSHKCDVCGQEYANSSILKIHAKTHSGVKPYKCDICGRGFTLNSYLKQHVKKHTGEKPYKCDFCGRGYAFDSLLKIHTRSHTGEKPFKCDVCGRGFTLNSYLKQHVKKHTGERPYKCDVCGRAFAQRGTWDIHKQTHTGEKPYQCDDCGHTYTDKSSLRKHTRRHGSRETFRCGLCGLEFVEKEEMKQHKQIHNTVKCLVCGVCGQRFKTKAHLKYHIRKHIGDKPYKCDVCGKSFTEKCILTVHKRRHTGEKPHKCDVCGLAFRQLSGLHTHKLRHTEEKPCV